MYDTQKEQNLGVLDHEDDELDDVDEEVRQPGSPPVRHGSRQSADEQRIVEIIEGRGAHEIHPGGPGVGGD